MPAAIFFPHTGDPQGLRPCLPFSVSPHSLTCTTETGGQ